jgi:hypothetical protein
MMPEKDKFSSIILASLFDTPPITLSSTVYQLGRDVKSNSSTPGIATICGLGVGEAVRGISVAGIEVAVAGIEVAVTDIVDCGVIVASCSKGNGEAGDEISANVDTSSLAQLIKSRLSNEIRMIVFIIFTPR